MQAMQQAAYFPTAMGMSPYSHFPLQPGVQQLTAATHQHKAKAKGGGAGGEGSNGVEVSRENQLQCFFIENQQSRICVRGLPKAEDLWPKPKVSYLRLWLRPLKV